MSPKQTQLTLAFLVVLLGIGTGSSWAQGCRELSENVWYEHPGHHVIRPFDSKLVRVNVEGGDLRVAIRAFNPIQGSFRETQFMNYVSSDGGETWRKSVRIIPSDLTQINQEVIQAPSDPAILYKYLCWQLGLYLRSNDGGVTWQMPRYSVEGQSRQELALNVVGEELNKAYVPRFVLSAIHPKQPLTLFGSVRLQAWHNRIKGAEGLPFRVLPGVYVSTDGGETWEKFTESLQPFTPLGISASDPSIMFGVSEGCIVKSTDGGKQWAPTGQARELCSRPVLIAEKETGVRSIGSPTGIEVTQFVIDPSDDDVVYVVSNKGIHKSLDGGRSWCLLNLGFDVLSSINSLALSPANPRQLFAGSLFGVFYSEDGGLHWKRIFPGQSNVTVSQFSGDCR